MKKSTLLGISLTATLLVAGTLSAQATNPSEPAPAQQMAQQGNQPMSSGDKMEKPGDKNAMKPAKKIRRAHKAAKKAAAKKAEAGMGTTAPAAPAPAKQ